MDPFSERLAAGVVVLDGALATELERAGHDLAHPLWSARLLLEDPEAILRVHRSYLDAGADVIASAGYQASLDGLRAAGCTRAEAERTYRESIRLAGRARDEFAAGRGLAARERPLVAASVGPYGAVLADGSEYRGVYDLSPAALEHFHAERLALVADEVRAGHADLVACETIPSLDEARLLARLIDEQPGLVGWISFSCRDELTTCEGQPVEDAVHALEEFESVVALGVNCTAPEHVPAVLARMGRASTRPLVCYPNAGERYDATAHAWRGTRTGVDPDRWAAAGARAIGGCCRTTPEDVARLAAWRDARR